MPPLQREVDRIVRARTRLLAELESLPRPLLERKPAPDEWSVLEVVEHLVLAEADVLADMDRPERLRTRRVSIRSRLGYAMVLGVLVSPFAVRVPSPAMRPSGQRSLEELRSAWEASHHALREHVAAVEAGRISGAVFVHPVSGPLTTRQAVRMLRVHLRRHEKQIRRILRNL